MEKIRDRLGVVEAVVEGKINTGHPVLNSELVCVQLRKTLEHATADPSARATCAGPAKLVAQYFFIRALTAFRWAAVIRRAFFATVFARLKYG